MTGIRESAPPPPPEDFSGGGPTVDEYTLRQMAMVAALKGKLLSIPELEALYRAATNALRLRYRILLCTNAAFAVLVLFLLVRS